MNATIATSATERPVAPIAGPYSQVEEFASIISAKLETSGKEAVTVLKRIETNTAVLRKLKPGNLSRYRNGSPPRERAARDVTTVKEAPFPKRRIFRDGSERTGTMDMGAKRDAHGRFVKATIATGRIPGNHRPLSKADHPEPTLEQMQEMKGQQEQQRGIVGAIAKGFQTAKGKVTEAAQSDAGKTVIGRALGGPMFEAAMELKDAKDQIRAEMTDEKSSIGKAAKWAMRKAGISSKEPATDAKNADIKDAYCSHYTKSELVAQGDAPNDGSDEVISAIMKGDKSDEKRHAELVKAILKTRPDTPRSAGLPTVRETGPGSSDKRRGGRSRDAKISKVTAFPKGRPKKGTLASLPGATLPGVNRPTGGGLGDLASMAMKVGPMLAALPLGAIAAGVAAVGAAGTAGYSAVTGKDNFISKAAQAAGFVPKLETDASGKITGVADAGKGYTTTVDANGDVVKRTGARNWRNNNPGNLEAGEFAKSQGAMGSDGRFAVFPDYQTGRNAKEKLIFDTDKYKGKSLTDAIARYAPPGENNTSSYQTAVLAAVGGKNKKMSEYTTDERQTIMDAMEKVEGFKQGRTEVVGNIAQKPKATELMTEGEATREKASVATMEAAPEPIVTATRITDARQRILSRTRARIAASGAGSLETKSVEGAAVLAEGKTASPEPVTSLATSVTAKPAPPERMTTARVDTEAPPLPGQGVKQAGSDMSGVLMAALDKLNATVAKISGQDKAMRPGAPLIRTEFDDTMLQLMAYDRV